MKQYIKNGEVKKYSNLITKIKNTNMTTLPNGSSGIPNGWTIENILINLK